MTDGTSNTLQVGEYTTRTHVRRRTFWAYTNTSYNQTSVTQQSRIFQPDYDRSEGMGGAGGAMSDYPGYWLIDGGGNPNNYEATMEYKLDGSKYFPDVNSFQRYYPGGIPAATEGKMTLADVLHVFTKMVKLSKVQENGKEVLKEEEIVCYRGREECDKVKSKERGA